METQEFLMVAAVGSEPAVLNKITSAFLKRHIAVESLNVSESPVSDINTVVVTARTDEETMRRLTVSLESVYDVVHAAYYRPEDLVRQELALYKVPAGRGETVLQSIPRRHKGRVIERNGEYIILEKSGDRTQLESLRQTLEKEGVLEGYSRSGNIVLHKDPLENFYEDTRISLAM